MQLVAICRGPTHDRASTFVQHTLRSPTSKAACVTLDITSPLQWFCQGVSNIVSLTHPSGQLRKLKVGTHVIQKGKGGFDVDERVILPKQQ